MKKSRTLSAIVAMLLTIAMMFGLVGCGDGLGLAAQVDGDVTNLIVQVEARGYGSAFARALADAYNAKQSNIRVQVIADANAGGYAATALNTNTDVDIFFSLVNNAFVIMSGTSKNKWADLSDVYNSPLVGYKESGDGVTVADAMDPYVLQTMTYSDGKQYALPYTSGFTGLVYNKTKWDKTNVNLEAAGETPLVMPKTTNELWALLERVNTQTVREASGGAYGFTYSAAAEGYLDYLLADWWGQYAGQDEAYSFFEGKDVNGVYTAEIFKSQSRVEAYNAMATLLSLDNGYAKLESDFNKCQKGFIKGSALFSVNGDWLEIEVSSELTPGDVEIEFVRTPVLSTVVNNPAIAADFTGSDAEKEAKLSAIITYIDENYMNQTEGFVVEESAAAELGVSKGTLEFLTDSRMFRYCLPCFVTTVPEYSDKLDEAKEFLKFMMSKEGQEVFMASAYGICAPMNVDMSQFDHYANATPLVRSRLDMMQNILFLSMESKCTPMQYCTGGFGLAAVDMVNTFAVPDPKSGAAVAEAEYEEHKLTWEDRMKLAGVSNG